MIPMNVAVRDSRSVRVHIHVDGCWSACCRIKMAIRMSRTRGVGVNIHMFGKWFQSDHICMSVTVLGPGDVEVGVVMGYNHRGNSRLGHIGMTVLMRCSNSIRM